jgi:hypothetical protein
MGTTRLANAIARDSFSPEALQIDMVEHAGRCAEGRARRERHIRELAYDYWQSAGEPEGRDLEFWLRAEYDHDDAAGYYDEVRAERDAILAEEELGYDLDDEYADPDLDDDDD